MMKAILTFQLFFNELMNISFKATICSFLSIFLRIVLELFRCKKSIIQQVQTLTIYAFLISGIMLFSSIIAIALLNSLRDLIVFLS